VAGADAFGVDFDLVQAAGEPAFTVDLDGFEGPLDLLLELARRQRVDLARISILALAEQYLEFVEAARKLRLELAADYLVMAAWLAFLKSRLLLPAPPQPTDQDASTLAEALARRLRALAAIRKAGEFLLNRPRLGRDFFARGDPEPIETSRRMSYEASLYDLLAAYARQAQRHAQARVRFKTRDVWSLAEARSSADNPTGRLSTISCFRPAPIPRCAEARAPPLFPPRSSWRERASLRSARSGRSRLSGCARQIPNLPRSAPLDRPSRLPLSRAAPFRCVRRPDWWLPFKRGAS
jgi:segregation and condensation protein A